MTWVHSRTRNDWGLDSPRDEWRDRRACSLETAGWFDLVPSKAFVPRLSVDNRLALRLCHSCPVQRQCRDYWSSQPAAGRASSIAGGDVWNHAGNPVPRTLVRT